MLIDANTDAGNTRTEWTLYAWKQSMWQVCQICVVAWVACRTGKAPAYWPHSLKMADQAYDRGQKECLSVKWAVEVWRPYLNCLQIIVQTDHDAPQWILDMTDETGNLNRCWVWLSELEFKVVHLVGVKHQEVEVLSRLCTMAMEESPLEDYVPVLMIPEAQPQGGNTVTHKNICHSPPCNDGMDTIKPALSEVLHVSDGTVSKIWL